MNEGSELIDPVEWLDALWSYHWAAALIVAVGSVLAAWIFEVAIVGLLRRLASRTETELDDKVLDLLKRPIYFSLLMVGLDRAIRLYDPQGEWVEDVSRSGFYSIAIVLWTIALVRVSGLLLKVLAKRKKPGALMQARTLPLFDILSKSGIIAAAIYLTMGAWHINVGAWLASAGIVGVAVGLAAQDSLSNYFAGVFIIADAPYKLHDVITLDDGTRGRVIDIGLRSTRIHTRDGVEINVPNSILGTMKIENRSGGPALEERIAVEVGVAYGSDVEKVEEILRGAAQATENLVRGREIEVYFKSFGASSLDFDVKVWIHPQYFETVRHELHVRIYEALNEAEIEIPFPQTDLHVKELPPAA